MGIVYEALDAALGRRVAIKTMIHSETANPEEAKTEGERFLREAQLAAQLPKHPHIVGVYEVGVIQNRRYLAMELIEGTPMDVWMRREDVTIREEVDVLRKTALAVHHAHENNVIHRDLKPANILIDPRNEPHITDFGLAKMVGQNVNLSLTGAGMVVGTPAYVSPEQAQGLKTTDRRTDVYSLGVMLFEILTGRHPFQGETAMEILMKAAKNPVPSASALMQVRLTPVQAKGLDDICHKALAKKPGERYRDAAAFAADLEKWLKGEEVKVVVPTRRAVATRSPLRLFVGIPVALLVLVVVLVQILSKPSVDPAEAERRRVEEMKLASERRAGEEKLRLEKEKLAAERAAAEERAKAAERELDAIRAPLMKAAEVKNSALLKPGLVGEFFGGANFEMLLQRKIDPEPKVSWKPGPMWPDGPNEMVTMRWRGYLRVPEKSTYAFQANATEGMRLFIDHVDILSNWSSRSGVPELAMAYLDQGLHSILIETVKTNTPFGGMWVTWKKSSDLAAAPMDASHYFYDPSGFTAVSRKASPELASRKSLPGAQEAEALQILESAPGSTGVLAFASRGKGFLLWAKAKIGDRLVLQFDAPEAGEKTLILALGRARNAGIVRISVNGAVVAEKVDFFHASNHFLEHEFKRVTLKKGPNELEFAMIGSNPGAAEFIKADNMPKFSMDYLRMR
jgi:serine/threonine protein kinase